MNLGSILQLREKKFWWMEVVLYLAISLLAASILCYLIFLVKNKMQKQDIQREIVALESVGTDQQKENEKEVINYQKKIADYAGILKNHQFASNVFAFLEKQTMPNVWFNRFSFNKKSATVELAGESDSQESFSRQLAVFEKNEYVKNVSLINSKIGDMARVQFNLSLALDPKIFDYILNRANQNAN